jgi:hypothetical protein
MAARRRMMAGKTQFHQNLAEMPICKRAQANENYRACELHYPRRDHLALASTSSGDLLVPASKLFQSYRRVASAAPLPFQRGSGALCSNHPTLD